MNRAIKDEDLTQSIALYVSKYNNISVSSVDCWIEADADYVRATEPLTVTFTALPDETVLAGRVASIDAQIETTRAELTRKIEDLKDQKQRLMAITHE